MLVKLFSFKEWKYPSNLFFSLMNSSLSTIVYYDAFTLVLDYLHLHNRGVVNRKDAWSLNNGISKGQFLMSKIDHFFLTFAIS